jgi:hypothetical protein
MREVFLSSLLSREDLEAARALSEIQCVSNYFHAPHPFSELKLGFTWRPRLVKQDLTVDKKISMDKETALGGGDAGATGAARHPCGMRGNRAVCRARGQGEAEEAAGSGHEGFDCFSRPDTTGRSLFLQIRRDSEDQNLGSGRGYRR